MFNFHKTLWHAGSSHLTVVLYLHAVSSFLQGADILDYLAGRADAAARPHVPPAGAEEQLQPLVFRALLEDASAGKEVDDAM